MSRIPKLSAWAGLAIGGSVFLGWVLDWDLLKGPLPGVVQMKVNTALGLVALALALLLVSSGTARPLVARILSGFALTMGAAVLCQYLFGVDLGIDEFLFQDAGATQTVHPGRLAPQTSLVFVLLGASCILLTARRVRSAVVDALALAASLIGLFSVIGYVYGASTLNTLPSFTPIAPHTALACLVLGVGVIAANHGGFIAGALTGGNFGSVIARRMLPVILLLVPAVGWLRLEGQQTGLYSSETGVALFVIASIAIIAVTVLSLAHASNRIDRDRQRLRAVEHRLATLVEVSHEPIFSIDATGRVTSWNQAAAEMYGYTAEEMVGQPVTKLHPPELAAQGAGLLKRILRGGSSSFETQRMHKDGRLIDVKLTATPIKENGELVGVCASTHDIGEQLRAKEDLEARVQERTSDLARSRRETLTRLALAAEFRDDDTARHTQRVGQAAKAVALSLGLSANYAALIAEAAPLHDVGKIGIPDSILLKPAELTNEEFEAMKQHTYLGADLLSGSDSKVLQLAERIALTHHERWDGRGYPSGLAGTAIPIAGRIVAVVDSFDAMTNDRPYKAAVSVECARAELERCSGTQFDPTVVRAFLRTFPSDGSSEKRPSREAARVGSRA